MKYNVKKIIRIIVTIILLFSLLYFIPIPQKINVELPAIKLNDETEVEYTLSINVWKLNFLFQDNKAVGKFTLSSAGTVIFNDAKFNTYVHVFPNVDNQKAIEYLSFSVYESRVNQYIPASIHYILDENYFVLAFTDSAYIAPADNLEQANMIYEYFKNVF